MHQAFCSGGRGPGAGNEGRARHGAKPNTFAREFVSVAIGVNNLD
jgi:hypothetical protein